MSVNSLKLYELLRLMCNGCVMLRNERGRYTVYDGTCFAGLVKEKVVADCIARKFLHGRPVAGGKFGEIEYRVTGDGGRHFQHLQTIREKHAQRTASLVRR
jgi:hypothetical protein